MKTVWTNATRILKGFRIIKTRMTKGIIEESKQSMPFGFDANPSKNYVAILAETESNEEPVIIGYLNPRALDSLNIGESIQYSTDKNGNIKATLIARNDGTLEILGKADNMVRYLKLDLGLKNQDTAINTELTKIAAAINSIVPGSYTPTPISTDISQSKIDEIKTI